MALVVEDGTVVANAEAYDTIANVDTYASNVGNSAWGAIATDALKEEAARRATRYMEAKWRLWWKGNKTIETQVLSWPRYNVLDEDGFVVDSDIVPRGVKEAFAEACLLTGVSTDLEPDVAPFPIKVVADVLEVEFFPGQSPHTVRSKVEGKIQYLLNFGQSLERSA